jgi:hypothetical protein
MIHSTVVKDSQNPYRTGVLVGNHVEDRFGQDLAQKDVSFIKLSFLTCLFILSSDRNFGRLLSRSSTPNTILEIPCMLMSSSPRPLRTFW